MNRRRLASLFGLLASGAFFTSAASSQAPGQTPPTNTSAPVISGSAVSGQTLTSDSGSWSGPTYTIGFQWSRCDSSGAACNPVSGATGSSYAVTGADAGHTLRATVTATNKNGSAVATSSRTAVVPTAPAATTTTTT